MENTRKYLLKKGTELNGKYIIESVISYGGSGVTYKAQSKTSEETYYCIKQCYPQKLNNNIRIRGDSLEFVDSLEIDKDSARELFQKYVGFFKNEKVRVLNISKNADNNNDYSILLITDSFPKEDKGGDCFYYNVYQTASSRTLWDEFSQDRETLSPSRVKWYIDIFIKLLKSLKTLHEEKLILHLDISPDNVLIMSEQQETVRLIDYGSSIKMNEDIPAEFIYSSKDGYSALELCEYSIGNTKYVNQLSPATDIFSVGACMFRSFVGKTIECSDYVLPLWKDELRKRCNISYDIANELIEIIEMNISNDMTKRDQSAEEMLVKLEKIHNKIISVPFVAPLMAYITKSKKRFYTLLASSILIICAILYGTCYGITSANMKNQIENAIVQSETNIFASLQKLLQIENTQRKFPFVHNDTVYDAIKDVVDYAPGKCLQQKKIFEKFDCVDIINEDYIGVKADSKMFLVNVNTFNIDYEVSQGSIIYTKDEIQYQPPFSSKIENGTVKKVDVDNGVLYINISNGTYEETFMLDTTVEKPVVKQIDFKDTIAENVKNTSEYTVYSKANEYFATYTDSPRIINVTNSKGESVELAHDVKVEKFGFRKDSKSIWTIDATGTMYLWSLKQDIYSYFDIIYDLSNNDLLWVISEEKIMYKIHNGSMMPIIEKPVSFIGRSEEYIYLSVKEEKFEYPILCYYDKNTDIIKQVDKLPSNGSYEKHIMPADALDFDEDIAYVNMAREILNFINGGSLPISSSDVLIKNNSIEFDYSLTESILPKVFVVTEDEVEFETNELVIMHGPTLYFNLVHPDGVEKIEYYFDGDDSYGKYSVVLNAVESVLPIIIPLDYQDEQMHTMYISLPTMKGTTSAFSVKFIVYPRENFVLVPRIEIQRGGRYMNAFSINANKDNTIVMDISAAQDIVVKCTFDNDARLYRYAGGKNTIKIPQEYLDGKQHTFLIQCISEKGPSVWYEYPFIYE